MSNIKCKKGDILVLLNPVTQQKEWVNPYNLPIYVNNEKRLLGDVIKEQDELKKEIKDFNNEYLKFKEDVLASQTDNLSLFNKMNNTIETLLKKVNKLENQVSTLLSINE